MYCDWTQLRPHQKYKPLRSYEEFKPIIVNIPDEISEPYQYFKLFFTDELLDDICNFTNQYAINKKEKYFKETCLNDGLEDLDKVKKKPKRRTTQVERWREIKKKELEIFIGKNQKFLKPIIIFLPNFRGLYYNAYS
jgi:hypothetical protein